MLVVRVRIRIMTFPLTMASDMRAKLVTLRIRTARMTTRVTMRVAMRMAMGMAMGLAMGMTFRMTMRVAITMKFC